MTVDARKSSLSGVCIKEGFLSEERVPNSIWEAETVQRFVDGRVGGRNCLAARPRMLDGLSVILICSRQAHSSDRI
jgi:hypothetical protein